MVVRSMEASVEAGNTGQALEFASQHPVADGRYYLVKGIALYRQGAYETAECSLDTAQTTPSAFGNTVQREASFWWAKNREALYRKKPNRENRLIALRGWMNFMNAFCVGDTSEMCGEAGQSVPALTQ